MALEKFLAVRAKRVGDNPVTKDLHLPDIRGRRQSYLRNSMGVFGTGSLRTPAFF